MISSVPLRIASSPRVAAAAGWVGALVLVALAVPSRLLNLDAFAGKFDEGIRGTQLMLMAAGYRPFRDIFASQGPLSLDVFFPTYLAFGQTLGAARAAPALFSVVGVVVGAWAARSVGGRVAGAVTGLLLVVSPIFLKNSRLALVEVPALVPALGAVGAALAYGRTGDRRWIAGAGVLMALALAIKPIVVAAVVPVGLAIVMRGRGWLPAGLIFSAALLAVSGAIVLAMGPADVYDQMVRFRAASRQVEGWSLKENWAAITGEMADERPALPVLAAAAGVLLLASRPRLGLPLAGWAVASLGLLAVYTPLQFKHAVVLIPPLMLLVGVGVGEAWRRWRGRDGQERRLVRRLIGGGAVLLGGWYLLTLPAILDLDRRLVAGMPESRPESYDDEIRLLAAITGPGDFVIVDEPSVAFASRRLVPPNLVDTSMVRIRSRSLDADDVIEAARRFDARALFLFSDGLRGLKPFAAWVDDEYVAIKINERRNGKDRAVYLRRDADFGAARVLLEQALDRPGSATFGGQLRLLGHGIERGEIRPGGAIIVTLGWQAIGPVSADYSVVTMLADRTGTVIEQNQRGLGGGGEGTASWEVGRWVFRTSTLALKGTFTPGDYQLAIGLYASKARRMVPIDGTGPDRSELTLATVSVRP